MQHAILGLIIIMFGKYWEGCLLGTYKSVGWWLIIFRPLWCWSQVFKPVIELWQDQCCTKSLSF